MAVHEVPDLRCRYVEVVLPPGKVTDLTDLTEVDADVDRAIRADVQVQGEPVRVRWDGGEPAQNKGHRILTHQVFTLHGDALRRARFTPAAPGSDLLPLFASQISVTLYYPDGEAPAAP